MLSKRDAAAELLARRRARNSLLDFAAYTHPRWQTGAHHKKVCGLLERVERGEVKRGMIFAPPRHTKSELVSRRFPAWYLGRNPTKQVITVAYAADLAVDFGADVRDIVQSQECRNVFSGFALDPDRTAASRWLTSDGGVYVAAGVGGPITGRGADLADIDDPFKNREDADSPRKREKVWRWYWSTLYPRLQPNGAILLTMTRWHADDLAGRLLKEGGWEVLELQAIADEDTDHEQALWPEWFPLPELREKRGKMPPREWAALYQQRPIVEGGTYCKAEWFEQRAAEIPTPLRKYMVSDLAVTEAEESESRGPDYTEHGVIGLGIDDHAYPCDWWYGRTGPDEWIDRALDLVKKHEPAVWFLEGGVIRRAVEGAIEKRMHERKIYVLLEWIPSIQDKATRGRAFQARASMKTWHFPRTPWADRVVDQCVAFNPNGSGFDDAFDVCSLFGRVVNETHPALAHVPKKEDRDVWGRPKKAVSNWRTA